MKLFTAFFLTTLTQFALKAQNSVVIGKQIWMTENLAVDHFLNGDAIPEVKSQEEWEKFGNGKKPAWCYYKNNPEDKNFGKLYNWYAIIDKRGLAPIGWHIPTVEEWRTLKAALCCISKKKQETFFKDFMVVFGGYRLMLSSFEEMTNTSYWWTSSVKDAFQLNAVYESLNLLNGDFSDDEFAKNTGLPIRCVKD